MNWRKTLYFAAHRATGGMMPAMYAHFVHEDRTQRHSEIARERLRAMLAHSATSVSYYRTLFAERGLSPHGDPRVILSQLPLLTKDLIRANADLLKSDDFMKRQWHHNATSGSTGEPIQLVQDKAFDAQVDALQMLYSLWVGLEVGEPQVSLWGSEREVLRGSVGNVIALANILTNRVLLNAIRMPPDAMRRYIAIINSRRPKLIVAFAQALYDVACFAEREAIEVLPQQAIISTAVTLYPFMREKLEQVFHCPVFNRYGSREVGDVAGECAFQQGLHVLPWGSYVEVVDADGKAVPAGTEGRIVVTCLMNYAMPLVRYDIGDRGALAAENVCPCGRDGQILLRLAGRNTDTFKTSEGALIDGGYFAYLLSFRTWVKKFQVVQTETNEIVYRVVRADQTEPSQADFNDIATKTRAVMGNICTVKFEFVEDIPLLASGKYRFTISLVTQ